MRISAELRAYEVAGALAEEPIYGGWLEDGRSCLTGTGELMAAGRPSPALIDGRTPCLIDRVLGRWQRLLSGLDTQTRLYFYLLRRPVADDGAEAVGDRDQSRLAVAFHRLRIWFTSDVLVPRPGTRP